MDSIMVITYHGEGCFRIQAGGETVIVTDPLDNRLKADIFLKTSLDAKKFSFPAGGQEISGPGEYEIKSVEINSWPIESSKDGLRTAYLVKADEMRLCFLGNASKADETVLSKLGEVDILFLPPVLAKIVKQIQPKIIIPSFFKNAKSAGEAFGEKAEIQEKLVIKKKDLPTSTKVIVLKF